MLLKQRNLKIFLVLNTLGSEIELELWVDRHLLLSNPDLEERAHLRTESCSFFTFSSFFFSGIPISPTKTLSLS